jgi:hypothetical protein
LVTNWTLLTKRRIIIEVYVDCDNVSQEAKSGGSSIVILYCHNIESSITYDTLLLHIPVHFVKEHRRMLAHAKKLIEYNEGTIAIHPRLDKLITSLRTAVEKGEGSLDKDATSYDDIFDAFRLSLQFYY